jgi:hypothetical protein
MQQWLSVLVLSTLWDMLNIRALAIKQVRAALGPDCPSHTLLNLGQTHHVDQWVMHSIVCLVERAEPMALSDVEIIGIENVLKISSIRETLYSGRFTNKPRIGVAEINRIKQCFGIGSTVTDTVLITPQPFVIM